MITTRQLATVRAALQYWKEEMCPHGAVLRYLEPWGTEPPTAAEIDRLARHFDSDHVRYVVTSSAGDRATTEVFLTMDSAVQQAGSSRRVATLLLPAIEPDAEV